MWHKSFQKELINKIYWWQKEFNLKDPFQDFDLIFPHHIFPKTIEYPHYKSRLWENTDITIQRWI